MMQAMIFAAGLGTRLRPLTDTMPKALVPVAGKPLMQHVLDKIIKAGADKVVVNVHHFANQIVDYLEHYQTDVCVKVSDETTQLLETGGGIKHARSLFDADRPVLIHNVDILSNVELSDFYASNYNADATLLVSSRKTKRYLLFDNDMRLVGWTNIETGERRSPHDWVHKAELSELNMYAFSGIHIFSPRLFSLMDDWPERFGIMDFYLDVCANANIKGCVKEDLRLMDVGKIDTLADADAFVRC
ncbi:MAG: nucleotidyltransferase family protein [Prevotella sp.]|nr:nucleotidyltransferase family protein [Prevotella sp.]